MRWYGNAGGKSTWIHLHTTSVCRHSSAWVHPNDRPNPGMSPKDGLVFHFQEYTLPAPPCWQVRTGTGFL